MQIRTGAWKKAYFFYGIVFFGIGLFGILSTDRFDYSGLIQLTFDRFTEELADAGLIIPRGSREVAVSNSGLASIVFLCPEMIGNENLRDLEQQIRFRLEKKAPLIRYRVAVQERLKAPQLLTLLKRDSFLIGLVINSDRELPERMGLIFSLPKTAAPHFWTQITKQPPELPLFKLELLADQPDGLYRFEFTEPHSAADLLRVVDILLNLWTRTGFGRNYKV
ncbi:MAG: hypothetical protein GX075_06200 [Firmicutes bacterium]|nr:hypothetical protein [Bacillota bacterium]